MTSRTLSNEDKILGLLNQAVVTYRFASYWGNTDYRCVEILMEKETFERLEAILGNINGKIGKQYEGGTINENNITVIPEIHPAYNYRSSRKSMCRDTYDDMLDHNILKAN